MSGKSDRKNDYLEQNQPKGVVGASESKKQKRKKVVILTCIIVVVLAGIGIGCVYLFNAGLGIFSASSPVTVTFDSTGGSEVESQTLQKDSKLTEVDSPSRSGHVFAGWYYEEAPVNAYDEDDVFSKDTTLYAAWYKPDMEVDKAEYISDCDSDISFVVQSEATLTVDNLADFINFSCVDFEDGTTLSVEQQAEGYRLYSEAGFTPGYTYSIEILDTNTVSFVQAGEKDVSSLGITSYNFTIYRENEDRVVLKTDPKLLSSSNVSEFEAIGEVADGETGNAKDDGKTIYRAALVSDEGDYEVGDIVSLGSGDADASENQYYKVYKVTANSSGVYLDLIAPNMEEIYSEYEVYYSGDAVYFEEDSDETEELSRTLQSLLKKSKGYDYLCTIVARSIKASPTLQNTVRTLDARAQERFNDLSVDALTDLLKNVGCEISFGKTQDLAYNDNGCYGRISFTTGDIGIDLAENITLTINLSISEDITTTVYGWQKLKDGKFYLNNGVYIDNDFSMSFSAVIATDSGTVNITDEIQNLIDSQSDDKTQLIVDSLNSENLFGDDLDYVEILSKQLGEKTITVYEVLTIQFTLDFKVSIGISAGLDLNFSSSELRKIGMCNVDYSSGEMDTTDMSYCNQRLKSEIGFTATLKGQLGIRAGFEAGVNFSMVHLNDYLNFGFSAEIGVYEEISGYLRFQYNYENSSTAGSSSSMSLAGGLKSETGVYVSLNITWNLFGYDDSLAIAEFKFPILTIGSLKFASEFEENTSAVTFNTTSYNLKSNEDTNLLNLKYIDINTGAGGVTIEVKPASSSGDYAFYAAQDQTGKGGKDDLKYVSVDKDTGMVAIADNAPDRLDFTVVVQYTKGCSLFSKDMSLITKYINFTYMKYEVEDSTQRYKATFYMPDGNVLEQKEYYVGQIPVPPAEDTYESLIIYTKYKVSDWSKPWQEDISAIYADTEYHLNCELNYKNISFYGDVYNKTMGKYGYGHIATVQTLCGELPTPPTVTDAEPGWVFDGWSPALRTVQTDYSYTATYKQDPNYCLYHFYVNGNIVSSGFVKIGDTPVAPDMSGYNTEDQEFVGWWPSVGATSSTYQTYNAVFRKYVDVTFEDKDGDVISEQRVLAGTTPKTPKVEDVVEGEEDYYEYQFSHWATEDGTKLGAVYRDSVYYPVYDTKYLEVITTFDADGHTFSDGTSIKKYTGTYAPYNFLYMPKLTYSANGLSYSVDYWQSTEKVNGSYVKLYMSSIHTDYKYNLTFKPVFKAGVSIEYTVRFDGGDQTIYLTGYFGETITADMLTGLKKTPPSSDYVYVVSNYGVALPYKFGTKLDSDGVPIEYFNVVVKFDLIAVDKTYTFDANGGEFSDGETVKTISGSYATDGSFTDEPEKADDALYTYQFVGWAAQKDATSGESYSDFMFLNDTTLYAVYSTTLRNYTVTFNAGAGYFSGGSTTINQTYHYGDTIVPPPAPAQNADAVYRYVFIGWQPSLVYSTTVTGNCTYSATFRAVRVDGTLEETGIVVSDGSSYEDICVNSISGYTYALVGSESVPTLTIAGDGLTFSGISDEVHVIIGTGVTSVTFDGLTLSGAYTGYVLTTESSTNLVTICVSGTCAIGNTGMDAMRFERPVLLSGVGTGAKLSVSGNGSYALYCADDFDVDSMELEIDGAGFALGNDEGAGEEWRFTDSTIRLDAGGTACGTEQSITLDDTSLTVTGNTGISCSGFVVSGASNVDVTASGEDEIAIETDNDLVFADFTGTFSASSTHATYPGIAVIAYRDIMFKEGGTEVSADGYDLGGTVIDTFVSDSFSSFGILMEGTLEPASSVTVTKS